MTDLLLPASCLPGLLDGWVGPMVYTHDGKGPADVVAHWGPWAIPLAGGPGDDVFLDLSLPEVRDRCARVLARVVGLECGSTAPAFLMYPHWSVTQVLWILRGEDVARFCNEPTTKPSGTMLSGKEWAETYHIPSLSTLDPSSDERLPDGSRKVDAMALKLVCEHVGVSR